MFMISTVVKAAMVVWAQAHVIYYIYVYNLGPKICWYSRKSTIKFLSDITAAVKRINRSSCYLRNLESSENSCFDGATTVMKIKKSWNLHN